MFNKLVTWALCYMATHKFSWRDERGNVNLGGIVIMGVAFIVVGLAIRFLPGMITSFGTAYTAANTTENIAAFPGLTDVLGFGPVGIVLGFICAVAFVGFLGLKGMFSKQ